MKRGGVPASWQGEMLPAVVQTLEEGLLRSTKADLLVMAGHTCSRDWIASQVGAYIKMLPYMKSQSAEIQALQKKGVILGIASLLGHGFIQVQEPNLKNSRFFERDANGVITGILPGHRDQRFSQCDKALRGGEKLDLEEVIGIDLAMHQGDADARAKVPMRASYVNHMNVLRRKAYISAYEKASSTTGGKRRRRQKTVRRRTRRRRLTRRRR